MIIAIQRKIEEDENSDKLTISNEDVPLDILDIHIMNQPEVKLNTDIVLDDIEVLS